MQNFNNEKSAVKGSRFENKVLELVKIAKRESKGVISYKIKPKIRLQNGEVRFPDFLLIINLSHEKRQIFLECQNRKRSSKAILEKIQHIRAKHKAKTFMFLYPNRIGAELKRSLDKEGITNCNEAKFQNYLKEPTRYITNANSVTRVANPSISKSLLMEKFNQSQVVFYSHPDSKRLEEEWLKNSDSVKANSAGAN